MVSDWVIPRWAIGSVRSQLDAADLALAVLLFDRIVLPTPENDEEFERWTQRGWRPDELGGRVVLLGDLVHLLPWDERLRSEWRARFQLAARAAQDTEGIALGLTPQVIASSAWNDVVGYAQREGRAPVAPVPVVWYPGRGTPQDLAVRSAPFSHAEPVAAASDEIARHVALMFRRELERPLTADPEEALDVAVRLSATNEFADARRALFVCEALVAAQQIDPGEAVRRLRRAADTYDGMVREAFSGRTTKAVVRSLVKTGADAVIGPFAALGPGQAVERVTARLIPIAEIPNPAVQAGASLSLARRAMGAVFAP